MKNKSIKEKSNKKIVLEFVAFLVVSLLVGFTVGFFTRFTDDLGGRDKVIEFLKTSIMNSVPVLLIITATLGIVIPIISFSKCKSMYDKLQKNMEDDDLWDTLEEKLNFPLIETNISMIVNLCLLFCGIHAVFNYGYVNNNPMHLIIAVTAGILSTVSFFANSIVQSKVVSIEKKLNPEKKGNVLDSNFHNVWLDSCDEAQKMTVYKAGYKACITTNYACSVIFVIGFFIIELFNLDIFALVLVAIIMGINNITYMVTGAKLEKRK